MRRTLVALSIGTSDNLQLGVIFTGMIFIDVIRIVIGCLTNAHVVVWFHLGGKELVQESFVGLVFFGQQWPLAIIK